MGKVGGFPRQWESSRLLANNLKSGQLVKRIVNSSSLPTTHALYSTVHLPYDSTVVSQLVVLFVSTRVQGVLGYDFFD